MAQTVTGDDGYEYEESSDGEYSIYGRVGRYRRKGGGSGGGGPVSGIGCLLLILYPVCVMLIFNLAGWEQYYLYTATNIFLFRIDILVVDYAILFLLSCINVKILKGFLMATGYLIFFHLFFCWMCYCIPMLGNSVAYEGIIGKPYHNELWATSYNYYSTTYAREPGSWTAPLTIPPQKYYDKYGQDLLSPHDPEGKWKKVQEHFDIVNGKTEGDVPYASLQIAIYYIQTGDEQQAKKWYKRTEEIALEKDNSNIAGAARRALDNWKRNWNKYYEMKK